MEDRFAIHLFTSDKDVEDEALVLTHLLDAGLDRLHIRKPSFSEGETEILIEKIPSWHHSKLILHDYPELAERYGTGFQFNGRNPYRKGNFASISYSCHHPEELSKGGREASPFSSESKYDFMTLSPIYPSISKAGYLPCFSIKDLNGIDLSGVVALGGISLASIERLRELGFGGAALLGSVWNRDEGVEELRQYLLRRNFSLQFITDGITPAETLRQAEEVLEGGGRWIQVRMKKSPKEEVCLVLDSLLPLCRQKGATLLVDDFYDLANMCDGVHLGQDDVSVKTARERIGKDKIIGLTVNNISQIERSRECLPDYYGVGPYRFTSTKKNLAPVLGLDGYRRLAPYIPRMFVAIGGIKEEDIPAILSTGASGIAISSLITRADNPTEMTQKLIKLIDNEK